MWLAGHANARPFFIRDAKCPDTKTGVNMVKSLSGVALLNTFCIGRCFYSIRIDET